ncbi:hypothetical protein SCHPADRAFT_986544 [Schizopora paradoxa]|uniref:Uncharacterized protein n=1 Tax=Schizopora paradoxa TaxID=27342 RepID=A0A0H2R4U8_9AGAM|nr:hypothetical protein SCHPADRAFT_986544 [Schizopora paradoxa]
MELLHDLEETRWNVSSEEIEIIRCKETWETWKNLELKLRMDRGQRHMSSEAFESLLGDAKRVDDMAKILKALLDAATELQHDYDEFLQPTVSKLSKGITSVPDEILALIFKFNADKYGRKQPIRLSQVSRKFRAVSLEARNLWTTLHSTTPRQELKLFIARSGQDTDLHIQVHHGVPFRRALEKESWDVCLAVAHRWKSLEVVELDFLVNFFGTKTIGDILKEMGGDYLDLPRLGELRIVHCRSTDSGGRADAVRNPRFGNGQIKLPWNTPNLRVLQLKNYTLSPSLALASLSSFTFVLELDSICTVQVKALLSFLVATPSITEFRLEACNFEALRVNSYQFDDVQCPSITSLGLTFTNYCFEERAERFAMAFTEAFHVPNIQQLSIAVCFNQKFFGREFDEEFGTQHFRKLSDALFPFNHKRPQLSSLICEILFDPPPLTKFRISSDDLPGTFEIPLDRVPNLASLALTTFTQVRFSRERSVEPCRLRELHFQGCSRMDGLAAIQSLKDIGVWESVGRVVVEDCTSFKYEEALDAIGKERLRFSNFFRPPFVIKQILVVD